MDDKQPELVAEDDLAFETSRDGVVEGPYKGRPRSGSLGSLSVLDLQLLQDTARSHNGRRVREAKAEAQGPIDETDAWVKYVQQMAMRGIDVCKK